MGKRVLLCDPAFDMEDWYEFESLGLGYLAGYLKSKGIDVELLTIELKGLSRLEKARKIAASNPDIIGFSLYISTYGEVMEIVKIIRDVLNYRGMIVLGGNFATFTWEELFARHKEYIDLICLGEGEITLHEIVESSDMKHDRVNIPGIAFFDEESDEAVRTKPREVIGSLDVLPFPRRIDFEGMEYYRMVPLSRGCYANCSFCSLPTFYQHTQRFRSPENVIREISQIIENYSVSHIIFSDDNFFAMGTNNERVKLIVDYMSKMNLTYGLVCRSNDIVKNAPLLGYLKDNGLSVICVGIESGNDRMLRTLNKGTTVEVNREAVRTLREKDIWFKYGFIMFDPYTTMNEIMENYHFLRGIGNIQAESLYNRYMPFPGSPLYYRLKSEGRLVGQFPHYTYLIEDPHVEQLANTVGKLMSPYSKLDRKITTFKIKVVSALKTRKKNAEVQTIVSEFQEIEQTLQKHYVLDFDRILKMDPNSSDTGDLEFNRDNLVKEGYEKIQNLGRRVRTVA